MKRAATLLPILGMACAGPAAAQAPLYRDATATHLPPGLAGACMDAAAGDADGDGDLDLALAMEFQPNVLLLNDGAGVFADVSDRLPRNVHDSEDVAFADFDGDGDADLVLVSEDDRTDELYLNDGTGRFADASDRLTPDDVSNALLVIDLNGDGAPDILTGNIGTDRALINDGTGRFRDETAERWPQDAADPSRTQDLEAADFDGDGAPDVIVANEGQNVLYLNRDGRLVAAPGALPQAEDETREIRAADVDADGDADLIVANVRFTMQAGAQDALLLNDGAGVFTPADPSWLPEDGRGNFTVQAADLDRDGDLDVLAPSTVFADSRPHFTVFARDAAGEVLAVRGSQVNIDDFDGVMDVALVGDGRDIVFMNEDGALLAPEGAGDGANAARPERNNAAPDIAVMVTAADGWVNTMDIDRDGDIDVIITTTRNAAPVGDMLVLLNGGDGRFAPADAGVVLPASAVGNGFDVEVADFDADGAADLFLCNRASVRDDAAGSGGLQRLLLGGG